MAGSIKGAIGEVISDVAEAVAPGVDQAGKALESGVSPFFGNTTTDPAQYQKIQERRLEEDKVKKEALRVIDWNNRIDQDGKRVRDQKMKQQAAQSQQNQQEEKVKQFKVGEKKQKDMSVAQLAERGTEIQKGVKG